MDRGASGAARGAPEGDGVGLRGGEIAGWLEQADPPRSDRRTPVRPVVAALAWHLRVGGAWRALPAGFPPWRTVYGWFRRWLGSGLLEAVLRAIARLRRRPTVRRPGPRLGIVDTQAVKCLGVRGPRGYDAGKKVWDRKRVVLVDAEGHWLAVIARRWVAERSFGWLSRWGGLVRDRAGHLDVSAARVAFAAIVSGAEALLNPMPARNVAR